MSNRGDVGGGRPWLPAWLVTGLAAWATVGVALVGRANREGLVEDISFSPYHLVGYAALLVLALYVGWAIFRALRRGDWRRALPPLYGGLGLGLVLILAWVVLDPIWRDTLGIRFGVEEALSPTRLLIPAALVLLAMGPVREAVAARAERGLAPGELSRRWAGVVATGLVGGALSLSFFNPLDEALNDFAVNPGVDNSEIWTMAADGSGQTRLLAALGDGVDYSLPAWSPDGGRIAYTAWTNDGLVPQNFSNREQTSAIWTVAADGSDGRLVVDGAGEAPRSQAWIPAWSPDGQWIAYTITPVDGSPPTPAEPQANAAPGQVGPPSVAAGSSVWIVHPDGTGKRRLTAEGVDAVSPAWSPDGRWLAFIVAAGAGGSDIHIALVTEDGLEDEHAVAADPANDWGPAWSRDSATLYFTSNRSGNDEIWSITGPGLGINTPDGSSTLTQLTDDGAGDWVPAAGAAGSRIAFVSERSGDAEVWTMAPDGSDPRNLTNHRWHADGQWSVTWAPDGERLAYAVAPFQDASSSGWVREDLAAAEALVFALELAIVALLLVALGAPLGSFTVALTIVVALTAIVSDDWRFVPAAVIAGAVVDLLVRSVRSRLRARVAATALPALATLAAGLTIGAAGTLAWSITLLLGVTVLAGAIGLGLAEVVDRLLARSPDVAPPTEAGA